MFDPSLPSLSPLEEEFYQRAIDLMKRKEQCIEECYANEMPDVIRQKLSEGWLLQSCYDNKDKENQILIFERLAEKSSF